jgi:acyl carrier protein
MPPCHLAPDLVLERGRLKPYSTMDSLHRHLAKLLVKSLRLPNTPEALGVDSPLFDGGLGLDSVDSVQWVVAVEGHFAVHLTDSELGAGALQTLGAMAAVLRSRGITEPASPSIDTTQSP